MDMKSSFIAATLENFKANPQTFLLVGDIGHFGFREIWESPILSERYLNIGILEQSMVGFAAGLSRSGSYPLIHTITPFLIERPFEQLKVDFSLNELKGCFISVGASFDYSTLGPTHHSYCDIGLFSSLYNSHVYSVSSNYELSLALSTSILENQLSYIRMNRNVHNISLSTNTTSPFIFHLHSGKHLTVVSTGGRTADILNVVRSFESQVSSSIDLFHVSKIHPLDPEPIFSSLRKTGRLLVIEDHASVGSLYSQLLTASSTSCCFEHYSLCLSSELIRGYGSYNDLSKTASLSISSITSKILEIIK
ncbi:hypothetical protein N8478_01395 [bacterium]|nr:hypothetical protein [bacterium]